MTPSKIFFAGTALLSLAAVAIGGISAGMCTAGSSLVIYALALAIRDI